MPLDVREYRLGIAKSFSKTSAIFSGLSAFWKGLGPMDRFAVASTTAPVVYASGKGGYQIVKDRIDPPKKPRKKGIYISPIEYRAQQKTLENLVPRIKALEHATYRNS